MAGVGNGHIVDCVTAAGARRVFMSASLLLESKDKNGLKSDFFLVFFFLSPRFQHVVIKRRPLPIAARILTPFCGAYLDGLRRRPTLDASHKRHKPPL